MKSIAKAQATLRDVAEKLKLRYSGSATIDTVREANDSDGWPMIFLSDGGVETASNPVIALRMKSVPAVSPDVFGNTNLIAFNPHTLEIAYELVSANNPIATDADIFKAEYEAILTGVRIQLKELANTTAVTAANMDAASPTVDIEDLYWPTKGM